MGKSPRFVPRAAEHRHPVDRSWARKEFLRAIQRQIPEALSDLHTSVFLASATRLITRRSIATLTGRGADSDARDALIGELRPIIRIWAGRWQLLGPNKNSISRDVELFLLGLDEAVFDTCLGWQQKQYLHPLGWSFCSDHAVIVEFELPVAMTFVIEGWSVLKETEPAFRDRAQSEFHRQLSNHIDARRKVTSGWPVLNRDLPHTHFDSLVLYQLGGHSINHIARTLELSRRTVSDGMHEAALEVIGETSSDWLRKPSRGGQPKKTLTQAKTKGNSEK